MLLTAYVYNERQSLADRITAETLTDAKYYYFRAPGMPILDSDHAACEGVSNGIRSLVFASLSALHLNSIYFGTFLKNYSWYCHQIFSMLRSYRGHDHIKNWGNLTKEFLGRRVVKKFINPYISLKGVMQPKIFTHVRALPCPHDQHIKSTPALRVTEG